MKLAEPVIAHIETKTRVTYSVLEDDFFEVIPGEKRTDGQPAISLSYANKNPIQAARLAACVISWLTVEGYIEEDCSFTEAMVELLRVDGQIACDRAG